MYVHVGTLWAGLLSPIGWLNILVDCHCHTATSGDTARNVHNNTFIRAFPKVHHCSALVGLPTKSSILFGFSREVSNVHYAGEKVCNNL